MEHPRRRSTRRVRLATAAVAGGALVGTGALTVVVAQAHPAAASSTTGTVTDNTTDNTTGTTDQQPTRPGGFGSGHGSPHASSGGS